MPCQARALIGRSLITMAHSLGEVDMGAGEHRQLPGFPSQVGGEIAIFSDIDTKAALDAHTECRLVA